MTKFPTRPGAPRGPRKEGGFKPRSEGGYKPRGEGRSEGRSEGGFGGGERSPYARKPREEGGFGGGERRPYARKPREEGGFGGGERRPYARKPREEGGFGSGERRPYARKPREEGGFGSGERRPYERKPREEGGSGGGERRPYARKPREEGGFGGGERRPYARKPREEGGFGGGERRPYARKPREEGGFGGGERRPYARKPREEGGFGGGERRPYARKPREEGGFGGGFKERGPQKFKKFERPEAFLSEEPTGKQVEFMHPQADGWLIGPHAVMAAFKAGRRALKTLWLQNDPTPEQAEVIAANPKMVVETKDRSAFNDMFGELVHQGIALEVGNLSQPDLEEVLENAPQMLLALDQITDPHNLGAILRSAAAFGVGAALTTARRAAGVTPVVAKAAAGGLELVPFVEVTNLSQSLKQIAEAGYEIIGLAGEGAEDIAEVKTKLTPSGKICIVMGSEGDGLRRLTREHCTHLARIAMPGEMESLNVSVATGIALFVLSGK